MPCVALRGSKADSRLIDACKRGEREAFRRLYDSYRDGVYSTALHFLHGDAAAAEDITQEVFLRLFTRIGQYRSEADFSTWLYRMVVNACIDEQRRCRRFVPFAQTPDAALAESAEAPLLRQELADSVREALDALRPEVRLTVLLKYFDDLSYQEMAQALGCSEGTVASRLHRGLKALARRLGPSRDPALPGEERC